MFSLQASSSTEKRLKSSSTPKVRKRKWISKQAEPPAIFSVSTDTLKKIIADVVPVPLNEIKLESSSEVEEVCAGGEHNDHNSPKRSKSYSDYEKHNIKEDNLILTSKFDGIIRVDTANVSTPSPSRNEESNILYITNLVRPFTVLQLKGLLARTGIIRTNGFWIDRIKSKCYVQYETEDEAIETRHALHGIRWPSSNPKCLNVDFGKKEDMQRAIISAKDDNKKCYESVENGNSSSDAFFKKNDKKLKPIREWDVGKNNSDGTKKGYDGANLNKKREEGAIAEGFKDMGNDIKYTYRKNTFNNSTSPARTQKKDSDPPLRLLDDLFRKTHTTPCIYWLPLTPEQIAAKEFHRRKNISNQQQPIKRRQMEVVKSFDSERKRTKEKHK